MSCDVPANEIRAAVHLVSAQGLYRLFDTLNEEPNVVKIEHMRVGANFQVTVHYTISDLPLQLNAVAAFIERCAEEANNAERVSS